MNNNTDLGQDPAVRGAAGVPSLEAALQGKVHEALALIAAGQAAIQADFDAYGSPTPDDPDPELERALAQIEWLSGFTAGLKYAIRRVREDAAK